jgi:hypothetical protein
MVRALSQAKQSFAERFEEDRDSYLFRSRPGAAGYRLSVAERDLLVARFSKRYAWAFWTFAAVLVVTLLALIVVLFDAGESAFSFAIYVAAGGLSGVFALAVVWLWNDPLRHVSGRTPDAPAESKTAVRRMALERLTWAQLGFGAGMAALVSWKAISDGIPPLLIGAGVLAAVVAVQALRKWRAGRP